MFVVTRLDYNYFNVLSFLLLHLHLFFVAELFMALVRVRENYSRYKVLWLWPRVCVRARALVCVRACVFICVCTCVCVRVRALVVRGVALLMLQFKM